MVTDAMVQAACEVYDMLGPTTDRGCMRAALEAALAAQGAEPVAWLRPETGEVMSDQRKREAPESYGYGGAMMAAMYTVPLYASPPAAQPVPDGYVLVPREPTPEMSAAGFCVSEAEHDPSGVYRAMIAAAQPAPAAEPLGLPGGGHSVAGAPGWIACAERMPPQGDVVLVWLTKPPYPFDGKYRVAFDCWDEQHESLMSFSTVTIPVGPGWDSGTDCDHISHWMPLPAPPDAAR